MPERPEGVCSIDGKDESRDGGAREGSQELKGARDYHAPQRVTQGGATVGNM